MSLESASLVGYVITMFESKPKMLLTLSNSFRHYENSVIWLSNIVLLSDMAYMFMNVQTSDWNRVVGRMQLFKSFKPLRTARACLFRQLQDNQEKIFNMAASCHQKSDCLEFHLGTTTEQKMICSDSVKIPLLVCEKQQA